MALTEADLASHFRASGSTDDRIGVEVELLAVAPEDGRPAGSHGIDRAVRAAPEAMSFEAPSQVEVRTAPARSLDELARAIGAAMTRASQQLGRERVLALALGFQPFAPIIASDASAVRSDEAVLGLAAAVHVSVSYRDEHDAQAKAKAARALGPSLVALFGGAPLVNGRVCGASLRSAFWGNAFSDLQVPDAVLAEPHGFFDRYAAWAASLPVHVGASRAASFRDWMSVPGHGAPGRTDWEQHLRMPTRDVRLKSVVELRCFDSQPVGGVVAAAAMVRGLLDDPTNLAWVTSAVPSATAREARLEQAVRHGASDQAFAGELDELVSRAAAGLERLGEAPAHLAWARRVIAERRNWGQTVAMLWTDLRRDRARLVREVAARTITAS